MFRFRSEIARKSIHYSSTGRGATDFSLQSRWLSDRKRRNENSAYLRSLRKTQSASQEESKKGVDYRYRKGGGSQPVAALWGEDANESADSNSQTEKNPTNKKKFAHFFDEIDEIMEQRKRDTERKANISSVFDSVDGPDRSTTKQEGDEPSKWSSGGRSIFDAFPVPDLPPPRSPNAFDEEAYGQYSIILEEVLSGPKFRREHTRRPLKEEFVEPIISWLRSDEKLLDYHYPLLEQSVSKGFSSHGGQDDGSFRLELREQKEAFLEKAGLSEKQFVFAESTLAQVGNMCAIQARSLPIDICWEKIKEAGIRLNSKVLNQYMYSSTMLGGSARRNRKFSSSLAKGSVFNLLGSRDTSADTSQDEMGSEEAEEDIVDVSEEIATFHDLLYKPTEQSLSVRVKALVAKGDARGAEDLLDSYPAKRKLRSYVPLLRCYLEQGDVSSGLRLFKLMRGTSTVIFDPETYVHLISTLAEAFYFQHDSKPIEGAVEIGYAPNGPDLLNQIMEEMSEDVLEISSASARRLYNAFQAGFQGTDMGKNLAEIHPLAPLAIVNDPATDGELIASRVLIDAETGTCPRSAARLRLLQLTTDQKEQLRVSLSELANTQYEEFGNWKKKRDHAVKALANFSRLLDEQSDEPYTAIVDGANVSFFMQNFSQGKFNFHQLQFMVDALEKMGERPLVILPYKYGQETFTINSGHGFKRQRVTKEEREIFLSLQKARKLYRVDSACLDDIYWMLASISDQTASRAGRDMTVPPKDESGRWPGVRPMLVTNDQMRDHKLSLIEPRLFRRWYSCYIVNYNFTAFVDSECVDRQITFSPADFFSREIQGNPTKNSDGADDGTAWHFPVSDWEQHERFCLRVPAVPVQ